MYNWDISLQFGDYLFIVISENYRNSVNEIIIVTAQLVLYRFAIESNKSFSPYRWPFEWSQAVLRCFPSLTVVAILFVSNRYFATRRETRENTRWLLTAALALISMEQGSWDVNAFIGGCWSNFLREKCTYDDDATMFMVLYLQDKMLE